MDKSCSFVGNALAGIPYPLIRQTAFQNELLQWPPEYWLGDVDRGGSWQQVGVDMASGVAPTSGTGRR